MKRTTPTIIESATSYGTSIEIISPYLCQQAIKQMQSIFKKLFPDPKKVSVVPILKGGLRLGQELAKVYDISLNPMRMSYYKEDTSRLNKPICLIEPDIKKIINNQQTKPVLFAEAVVESQATVCGAIKIINDLIDNYSKKIGKSLNYPEYYTFAMVSKVGEGEITIPNFYPLFCVDKDIWVIGYGCDLYQKGRELNMIKGIISPFHKQIPQPPYFKQLF